MRLLIVDDYEAIGKGLRALLSNQLEMEVCGEAVDGRDAIDKAMELRPDAISMDISMPNMNGLDATREIVRLLPHSKVVILNQHDSAQMRLEALMAGAAQYVLKSANLQCLITAILERPVNSTADDGSACAEMAAQPGRRPKTPKTIDARDALHVLECNRCQSGLAERRCGCRC